ncbi:hypothetical protein LCGC14_0258850 [marine sediment metagenome]|uniref:Uncharacterized protein n=1 Tax=marine sediment metagenome TaxID=412755 RepID=A0A0F9U2G4_9ZZZZ
MRIWQRLGRGIKSAATASYVIITNGVDVARLSAANLGHSVTDIVLSTQHLGADGNPMPSGFDAAAALATIQLGQLMSVNGQGIARSGIHFTAVRFSATEIDLAGGFPSITNKGQFIGVAQISSAGVITIFYPQVHAFDWNAANARLTITGATFDPTDTFVVVITGADRYANDPGNYGMFAEVGHFPTRGDSAGADLLPGGAQAFTAGWVDVGPEIGLLFIGWLETFWTLNINDSTGLQVRLVEKHESGGAEEYPASVETYGVAAVAVQAGYHAITADIDQLLPLSYKISGKYPVGQLQIKAGVLGAGVDASADALRVIRSTFEG